MRRGRGEQRKKICEARTVDSDGNGLREDEAVLALESGDLSKRAGLQVLDSSGLSEVDLDDVQVDVVGLSDRLDGSAARVVL